MSGRAGSAAAGAALELFELEMLGGSTERHYRRMRPDVDALPWGTLDLRSYSGEDLASARAHWTVNAFQEQRTGAACAETVRALLACRAPLDLVALATRFPLDEVVHVEMCARIAEELGGGWPVEYDPRRLAPSPERDDPPLLQAAEMIVAVFCVGEAFSVPIIRATWRATRHPLVKAVIGIILRDEAAHGRFGWAFLDWAGDALAPHRPRLAEIARLAIEEFTANHREIARLRDAGDRDPGRDLGWMSPTPYLALGRRAMSRSVIEPLRRRGIDPYDGAPDPFHLSVGNARLSRSDDGERSSHQSRRPRSFAR